jgi:CRP-like cAMP-binding protein
MNVVKPFYDYLEKFVELTESEFHQYIYPYLIVRKFAKKQIITEIGETENHFNFIVKGLARKYYKKGKEEINTQIASEGNMIYSLESFHGQTPSEYCVEAIEPTTLVSIVYDDLEKIFASSSKMEHLGRLILIRTIVLRDRNQMQIIKHTPRERFVLFVESNADLLQRVPQKYLASYLNIKPETFSRFKHLVRNGVKAVMA